MALNISSATRSKPGENLCGDACAWWCTPARIVLALADGLGHGEHAARAAQSALACIDSHPDASCADLFARCDNHLRNTRGAALAVAIIEPDRNRLTVASVGNIRALLLHGPKDLRLGGARGIVGAGYRQLSPDTLPLAQGDMLVLFSDGFDEFPPIRPLLSAVGPGAPTPAQMLLEHCARDDDDASVLIYRHGSILKTGVIL